jgi:hypothetical protein
MLTLTTFVVMRLSISAIALEGTAHVLPVAQPPIPQAAVAKPLASPSLPLSVLSSTVDGDHQTVTFTLQNTGTQAVTAWDVRMAVGTEPDALYGNHGVDAFREFAGLVQGSSYIVPGGTVTATAKLPSGSEHLSPVVITPTTVVFADTSFIGNDKFAQLIFDRRGAQLAAWRDIANRLQSARASARMDVGTLDALLSEVNTYIERNGADIVRLTFRANLSLAISDARAGRGQPLSVVNRFLADAERNITVAAAHTKR